MIILCLLFLRADEACLHLKKAKTTKHLTSPYLLDEVSRVQLGVRS